MAYIYITEGLFRQICNRRYIAKDILQQMYQGRYSTAHIYMLQQIQYGRYITAYVTTNELWHIYIYICKKRINVLRQTCYGRYITANLTTVVLRTTTTAISQQIYSASRSRLLHLNLIVATQRPNDSPGLLYPVYAENGALSGQR